jgi:hypothetical protein
VIKKPHDRLLIDLVKTGKYTNFWIEEDQLNYEWHLGTKLDYLMPERTKMLRTAEIDILTKICDIERKFIISWILVNK